MRLYEFEINVSDAFGNFSSKRRRFWAENDWEANKKLPALAHELFEHSPLMMISYCKQISALESLVSPIEG